MSAEKILARRCVHDVLFATRGVTMPTSGPRQGTAGGISSRRLRNRSERRARGVFMVRARDVEVMTDAVRRKRLDFHQPRIGRETARQDQAHAQADFRTVNPANRIRTM